MISCNCALKQPLYSIFALLWHCDIMEYLSIFTLLYVTERIPQQAAGFLFTLTNDMYVLWILDLSLFLAKFESACVFC